MITGLGHVSIVVPDLDAAARLLTERYGLTVGAAKPNDQQGVRLAYIDLPAGGRIELMEPTRPDSPVANFLVRNPKGGIHHLCLGVDDVEAAARQLTARDVRMLGDGRPQHNVEGERIAFIHPGDFLGALVELEQHRGT